MAQPASTYKPTKRGGGGPLKLLWWQGRPCSSAFCGRHQGPGRFAPVLRAAGGLGSRGQSEAEARGRDPTKENGGLSADGLSVTWKLKQGVTWHDGKPFTPTTSCSTGNMPRIRRRPPTRSRRTRTSRSKRSTSNTVVVKFKKPTPFWADAFVGTRGMLIPKHLSRLYRRQVARRPHQPEAGRSRPLHVKDFKPGDLVTGVMNPNYHQANKPYFDTVEMKGGGDAVSAARAVLQTGEFDFA